MECAVVSGLRVGESDDAEVPHKHPDFQRLAGFVARLLLEHDRAFSGLLLSNRRLGNERCRLYDS